MKKRITFFVLCILLAGTMVTVTAFADNVSSGKNSAKATAVENEMAANADEPSKPTPITWTPSGLDLRDRGVVTPVKSQAPWNTCWSFGAIAASEISILSMNNQTYEDTGLDLSERHLIYFAQNTITKETDESQAGEGIKIKGSENEKNGPFVAGQTIITSSLLSSGVGPMDEESFPYRGKEGNTEYQYLLQNKEQWKKDYIDELKKLGPDDDDDDDDDDLDDIDDILNNDDKDKDKDKDKDDNEGIDLEKIFNESLEEVMEGEYQRALQYFEDCDAYSTHDDWSIPAEDRNLSLGYTLIDGNNLPPLCNRNEKGDWTGLNKEGIDAVKKELAAGRGVSVSFYADDANFGTNTNHNYMNTDTWAHYTYDNRTSNHAVCIVGYDDNYPKENFTHTVYKTNLIGNIKKDESGKPIQDEEKTALTTPAGNGAWIVKNSWGSETDCYKNKDGREINKGHWGIVNEEGKHTGYFYLSYYDTSVTLPESFRFAQDLDAEYFDVYQYDYMPAISDFFKYAKKTELAAANVYEIEESEKMMSIGVRTMDKQQKTEFSIYKLNPDAKTPTDGTLLGKYSAECEYAGFHRIALSEPIHVDKGDKISIVSKTLGKNDKGETVNQVFANMARGAELTPDDMKYGIAVVNPGESYIYDNSSWHDWSEYMKSEDIKKVLDELRAYKFQIDNFTIKGYFLPEEAPGKIEEPSDHEADLIQIANTLTKVRTKYTKKLAYSKKAKKVLKLSPKAKGGARISYSISSIKKGSKKIRSGFTVTSRGVVKTKKKLSRGNYTVKVKIKAKATKQYKAKTKVVTLKVRIK